MSPEALRIISLQKLLLLLVVSHAFAMVMVGATPPFTILPGRADGDNVITLTCQNSLGETEGTFYLNETVLSSSNFPDFDGTSSQPGEVRFKIERSLEGSYSCGDVNERSNSIQLIGESFSDVNQNSIPCNCMLIFQTVSCVL